MESRNKRMNYIMELRKLVGTRPLVVPGACVIVLNEQKEVLLQLRRDNHCWGFAGGALDPGETLEQAAARELFEETGLTANRLELFNVYSGNDFYYKYPHGDEVYNVISAYICRDYQGRLVQDDEEVADLRFFRLDDLPDRINPPEYPILLEFIKAHQS